MAAQVRFLFLMGLTRFCFLVEQLAPPCEGSPVPVGALLQASITKVTKMEKTPDDVINEAVNLDPFANILKSVRSVNVVQKAMESHIKYLEDVSTAIREEAMGDTCGSIQAFKDRLRSAISQAKKIGAKRPQFTEIFTFANSDLENGIQYIEGMMRQLALSATVSKQKAKDFEIRPKTPAVTNDPTANLGEWKTYAQKRLQLYAEDLQRDMKTYGAILTFTTRTIDEAVAAVESIENELKDKQRYLQPQEMEKRERKIKRALGVDKLYREDCLATNPEVEQLKVLK